MDASQFNSCLWEFSSFFLGIMGEKSGPSVDYDAILDHIGQFGPWQKRIFFLLWLTSAAGGLAVVVYTFTAFSTPYHCKIPYCQNKYIGDITIPGKCQYYDIESRPTIENTCDQYLSTINKTDISTNVRNCTELVYDQTYVTSSLGNFHTFYNCFYFIYFYFKA